MPSLFHSIDPTPDERFRELARLLAVGLLRLNAPITATETRSLPDSEISSKSGTNELAVCGKKSVTVHVG